MEAGDHHQRLTQKFLLQGQSQGHGKLASNIKTAGQISGCQYWDHGHADCPSHNASQIGIVAENFLRITFKTAISGGEGQKLTEFTFVSIRESSEKPMRTVFKLCIGVPQYCFIHQTSNREIKRDSERRRCEAEIQIRI